MGGFSQWHWLIAALVAMFFAGGIGLIIHLVRR